MFLEHTLFQYRYILNDHHREFIGRVCLKGEVKYGAKPHFYDFGGVEQLPLWDLPEQLGFIESIGSYKFKVTKKYTLLKKYLRLESLLTQRSINGVDLKEELAGQFLLANLPKASMYDDLLFIKGKTVGAYDTECNRLVDLGLFEVRNGDKVVLTKKGLELANLQNYGVIRDFNQAALTHDTLIHLYNHFTPDPLKMAKKFGEPHYVSIRNLKKLGLVDEDDEVTVKAALTIHTALGKLDTLKEHFCSGLEYEIEVLERCLEHEEPELEEEIPTREHRCTIKETHRDGVELDAPVSWCGRNISKTDWAFQDAQHLARAVGGSVQPCKKCVAAVIKELSKEL